MRLLMLLLFTLSLTMPLSAQDLGPYYEASTGNWFGVGARQMAMGGAGIAASIDGAAMIYNPAALARIPRVEIQFSLTQQKFSNSSRQNPGRYDGYTSVINGASISENNTRFSTANLVLPVPTYRGSLVVAFGINRIINFDRVSEIQVLDIDGTDFFEDYAKESSDGSIYAYTAAAGIDISPNVSVGAALNIFDGKRETTLTEELNDQLDGETAFNYYTARTEEEYSGASIKGGFLYRPNSNFSLGITVESPVDYSINWFLRERENDDGTSYEDFSAVEYDLMRPFTFGAGAMYRIGPFTITGDIEYIDWSQLEYNDNSAMELDNDTLSVLYRDVANIRVGAEYQIPSWGAFFRAGVFSHPLPYSDDFIDDDRMGFSLGAGLLIDRVVMVDVAYVHGSYQRRYTGIGLINDFQSFAEDSFDRVFVTASYRY